MTNILGLNAHHWDASAALVCDGEVLAAVSEERLGDRFKHQPGFPKLAIERVLDIGGIAITDVDFVAVGYDPNANSSKRIAYAAAHPMRTARVASRSLRRRSSMSSVTEEVAEAGGASAQDTHFEIVRVEHHLAHISSSFYTSPFQSAAAFSFDAAGDFVTTMYARRNGADIEVLDRVYVPNSLGYFYTALCQFIGFDRVGEEYKVMGLGAYGEPRYMDLMNEMLWATTGGQFEASQKYLKLLDQTFEELAQEDGEYGMPPLYTDQLIERLGEPRKRGADITQREMDIAASCQKHFEDTAIQLITWLHLQVPEENLVLAGGCALNGVTNARILRDTPFENTFIHCAATDDGLSIGAAMWAWHNTLGNDRLKPVTQVFLGDEYSESRMAGAFEEAGLQAERLSRDALLERTADHLNNGHVVGWYQGRYEWGPCALGNRSILAHPGWPGMKDAINRKIKRRESFRPFAPSILAERVPDYFEQDIESPFMMHVVKIREDKRDELAAVRHEDDTGRLHTVTRDQNPLYYDLIATFSERSGTPVVLNTSFNENEPIVDTPEQAVSTFLRNDVDVLVLGDHIATKAGVRIS